MLGTAQRLQPAWGPSPWRASPRVQTVADDSFLLGHPCGHVGWAGLAFSPPCCCHGQGQAPPRGCGERTPGRCMSAEQPASGPDPSAIWGPACLQVGLARQTLQTLLPRGLCVFMQGWATSRAENGEGHRWGVGGGPWGNQGGGAGQRRKRMEGNRGRRTAWEQERGRGWGRGDTGQGRQPLELRGCHRDTSLGEQLTPGI